MATTSGPVNLAYAIVALVVVVIVIATVTIPVIESAQTELKTEAQNTGQTYLAMNQIVGEISIANADGVVTIGDYSLTPEANTNVIVAENFAVTVSGSNLVVTFDGNAAVVTSLTASSTGITYTGGSKTYGSYAFILSQTGDYGVFMSGDTLNFNADTTLYLVGDCSAKNGGTTKNLAFGATGTYSEMSGTFIRNITDATGNGDLTAVLSATEERGYLSATLSGTSVSVSYELSDTEYTASSGTWRIIAPLEYTYIADSDVSLVNLLGIIPVLLILVPVMMAVALLRGKS